MEKLQTRNVISVVNKRNNSNHMLAGTLNTPSKKKKNLLKDFLWKDEMLSLSETFYRDSFSQVENAGIWTVQQVCCLHLNYNSAI